MLAPTEPKEMVCKSEAAFKTTSPEAPEDDQEQRSWQHLRFIEAESARRKDQETLAEKGQLTLEP